MVKNNGRPTARELNTIAEQYPGVVVFFVEGEKLVVYGPDTEAVALVLDLTVEQREIEPGVTLPAVTLPTANALSLNRLFDAKIKFAFGELLR